MSLPNLNFCNLFYWLRSNLGTFCKLISFGYISQIGKSVNRIISLGYISQICKNIPISFVLFPLDITIDMLVYGDNPQNQA